MAAISESSLLVEQDYSFAVSSKSVQKTVTLVEKFIPTLTDDAEIAAFHTLKDELGALRDAKTPEKTANFCLIYEVLDRIYCEDALVVTNENKQKALDAADAKVLQDRLMLIKFYFCYTAGVSVEVGEVFRTFFRNHQCKSVLEVGSGVGRWSRALSGEGIKLTATDNYEHLFFATRENGKNEYDNFSISEGYKAMGREYKNKVVSPTFSDGLKKLCVHPVENIPAADAIKAYCDSHDALLIVCPIQSFISCLLTWPKDKLIVFVAPQKFNSGGSIQLNDGYYSYDVIEDDTLNKLVITSDVSDEPLNISIIKNLQYDSEYVEQAQVCVIS
ncbi:hypothetical protein SOPP22_16195 [Shewanella sp. OPT22]|nr:hypothetical protein SOPP22_16195 [Shewanella sp. OPT22]